MGGLAVDRDMILRELMELDFMVVDLQLFLDTHPNDREALETYNSVIERANEFRRRYEAMCGPLYS